MESEPDKHWVRRGQTFSFPSIELQRHYKIGGLLQGQVKINPN